MVHIIFYQSLDNKNKLYPFYFRKKLTKRPVIIDYRKIPRAKLYHVVDEYFLFNRHGDFKLSTFPRVKQHVNSLLLSTHFE